MQDVVIRIKGDSSDIIKLGEELKKLGKVDADNAKQFEENNKKQKKATKEQQTALQEVLGSVTDIRGQLIDLGKTLVAAFAVESIIAFGKESVKAFMEAELNANKLKTAITTIGGEGSQAFNKLIEQSEKLQEKGIFSDDAIQMAQTQLAQYGLFSQEIEDIIPLIADMAAATGMDLGSATDKVISGLNGMTRGLKSVGIDFKDTGSIAGNYQLVLQGLTKFHGQMDSVMDTSSGKVQNFGNRWEDFKEQVGGAMMALMGGSQSAKEITKDFDDQVNSVLNLQQNIIPLANRYDELSKKGKLSKDEQKELNKAIEEISMVVPGAISSIDNYGKAIAINTDRVRQYLKNEVDRLKAVNAEAIEDLEDARKKQDNIIKLHQKQIDQYLRGEKVTALGSSFELSDEQIQDIRTKYNKALSLRNGYDQEIARLNGDYLKKEIDARQKEADNLKKAQEDREAAFKAEKDLEKKKEEAKEAQREKDKKDAEAKKKKEDDDKKAVEARKKAAQEIINTELRIQQALAETAQVENEFYQKYIDAQKIIIATQEERKILFAKVYGDETDVLNLEFEKQKKAIDERYGKEIKAVEDAGMDASALRDAQQLEQELAYKEHQDKLTEINKKSEEQRLTDTKQSVNEWSNIFSQSLDVFNNINQIAYNTDLQYYQNLLDNKQISEEQFNEKQKELARRKAQRDKEIAIFNTIISTARAVTEALPNLALSVLAGVLGAAQLGVIISQPEPKLAKGTAFLKRGKNPSGIDTIPAMLNEGEAVIPTERNLENPGLADAWIKGNLEQYINNKYVVPALKANRKGFDDESFINKLSKSMSLNAAFNDGNLLESDKMSRRLLMEQNQLLKKIVNGSNKNPYRF